MHSSIAIRLAGGVVAAFLAVSVSLAQEKSSATDTAKDAAQQTKQSNEDLQKARQQAREIAQQAREKIQENRQDARQGNRDARQDARKDVRDTDNRNERQDARKETRDSRESVRETRRDMRDLNRDERRDVRDERGQRVQSFFRGRLSDLGVKFEDGADRLTISELDQNSAGTRIGLRRGDTILSVNGRGVRNSDDFNRWIASNPGQGSAIIIQRNGRQYTLQMPWMDENRSYSYDSRSGAARAYLGVSFDPNYREFAVVREVKADSPAEKIGLKSGDTLTHINGQEVRSLRHAIQTLSMMPVGEEFDLEFDRPQHQSARVALVERTQEQRSENREQQN
jgi:C-terminal processing protease CtpA/Prc